MNQRSLHAALAMGLPRSRHLLAVLGFPGVRHHEGSCRSYWSSSTRTSQHILWGDNRGGLTTIHWERDRYRVFSPSPVWVGEASSQKNTGAAMTNLTFRAVYTIFHQRSPSHYSPFYHLRLVELLLPASH